MGGLCLVDGEIHLNVLLPRRTGTRVTNESEAKAGAAIVPKFGPVATKKYPGGYETHRQRLWDLETMSPVLSRGYRWLLSSGLIAEESKIMGNVPAIFWGERNVKLSQLKVPELSPTWLSVLPDLLLDLKTHSAHGCDTTEKYLVLMPTKFRPTTDQSTGTPLFRLLI